MSHTGSPIEAISPRNRLPLIALILGGMVIGGSPIFVRLSEIGPMGTAFWRVALAFVPLYLFSQVMKPAESPAPKTWHDYVYLALPGVFLAADLLAWHLAIHITTVVNATLLANLAPVFVTLIGWLFLGALVSRSFTLGLVVAIAGVVVLKGGLSGLAAGEPLGDALAVIAALFYAGYILAVGRLRGRFNTIDVMLWSTASAAICVLPAALLMESTLFPITLHGWAMLFGLAFLSHVGGQVAITYALAYLPAAFSSLTLLLQPVVAAILGALVLGELMGPLQIIGGAIVLAGVFIARRQS